MSKVRCELLESNSIKTIAKKLKGRGGAHAKGFVSIMDLEEIEQEICLFALDNEAKLNAIYERDGKDGVDAYLYRSLENYLSHKNAALSAKVYIGEPARKRDPDHIRNAKISAMKEVGDPEIELQTIESHYAVDPLEQLLGSETYERISQTCPVFFSMTEEGDQKAALNLPLFVRKSMVRKELFELCLSEGLSRQEASFIANEGAEIAESRHLKMAA